jgi:tetratricopeptide (TPR) repeat protein
MPAHIFYNLGYIYYTKDKDYTKSSDYFRRAFVTSGRRSSPTIDTAMGLSNLRSDRPDMAKMYFGNVIDYYKDNVARINRDPDPQSMSQNHALWQLASAYNNLGVAQYMLYKKSNDQNYIRQSRESFWKAIEYASKFNSEGENSQARINLRDSILKDNAKYIEHYRIQNRDPIISDFIPYEMN